MSVVDGSRNHYMADRDNHYSPISDSTLAYVRHL